MVRSTNHVMANRKIIDNSYVRSLLMRKLYSSSSDEDDLGTTAAMTADDCEETRCRNDIARLTSSSSDEEKTNVRRFRDPSRDNRLSPTSNSSNSRSRLVEQATGQDTTSRRDSNPFSFKAFLKNGTQQTNYHNTGARPKVYSSPTSSPSSAFDKDNAGSGVYSSRNPTELPDFVQDHLVIEQCYLNHESDPQLLPEVDNLPDFALNSVEQRQSRLRSETKKNDSEIFGDDLRSFDLTDTLHKGSTHRDNPASNAMHSNHLDLPVFGERLDVSAPYLPRPEQGGFPFDLPLPFAESNPNANATIRDGNLPGNDTSVHKSLPDFLSDGPIYNRSADPEPTSASLTESTERRLLLENERLHQQLETARRQINEKTERIRSLEAELLSKREVEHEETAHLEKAMEQVEDNLKRSTKRAVNAESTVTSLKKKIKALTAEISLLRLENDQLRSNTSTSGQGKSNTNATNMNHTTRRLARDLFAAASSAEVSLRQLISGVDNLRVLASTLENMNKIEDWTKDFVSDSDEDIAAGPAV